MPTKDTGPNHVCDQCGKPYFRKYQKRFTSKFCSRSCMYESHKGVGNPNYRHGQNLIAARDFAKRNGVMECMVCGWNLHVHVHHIMPRSQGGRNDPENLVVLCPNHHWMAQHGHLPPQRLEGMSIAYGGRAPESEG